MKAACAAALCSLVIASASARAEPLYVIDQLVLSVSSEPGGTGGRIATIKSGDSVELLDRQGEEAHIRLANGASGWVKASYLSRELPLQRRLSEQTAEVESLRRDIGRLQAQLPAARAPHASPGAMATATPAARAVPTSGAAPVASDPGSLSEPASANGAASAAAGQAAGQAALGGDGRDAPPLMSLSAPRSRPAWGWVLGSAVLALAAGFVAGWRTLDRRIRQRYGGLRIY